MIVKKNISKTLKELNSLYNKDVSGKHAEYYSKLAHLELCGWIELAQDDIVLMAMKKHIKDSDNIKAVKEFVKKNSNMGYNTNLKSMLVEVIGYKGFEKLEALVDPSHKNILDVELEILKATRNSHAHTNIKDCTRTLDAPSVNLARFEKIFDALKCYERVLKSGVM